jgi:hypothetical protein
VITPNFYRIRAKSKDPKDLVSILNMINALIFLTLASLAMPVKARLNLHDPANTHEYPDVNEIKQSLQKPTIIATWVSSLLSGSTPDQIIPLTESLAGRQQEKKQFLYCLWDGKGYRHFFSVRGRYVLFKNAD